jgi:hypothetical protein
MKSNWLLRAWVVTIAALSFTKEASASTYQVWLGYIEAFSVVSAKPILFGGGQDSDYLALSVTLPSGDNQSYSSPAPWNASNNDRRHDFRLIGDPFQISANEQVTIGWTATNRGNSNAQAAAKEASDLARQISVSTGNPIAVGFGLVLGALGDQVAGPCDMVLFQQRIRLSGNNLDNGLQNLFSNIPWSPEGANQWHAVYGPYDFDGPPSCGHGRYNLEVHVRRTDTNTVAQNPSPAQSTPASPVSPSAPISPSSPSSLGDHVHQQITGLYGPLNETLKQGEKKFEAYMARSNAQFGHPLPLSMQSIPDGNGGVVIRLLPIENPVEWKAWVDEIRNDFTPTNNRITSLIKDNPSLYEGAQVPNCFQEWFGYMHDYDIAVRWIARHPQQPIWYSTAKFPDCLQTYVAETLASLRVRENGGH